MIAEKEQQRQTLAWAVLLGSFVVFLALVSGAVLAVRWYMDSAIESRAARLTIISGTVLIREANQSAWVEASTDSGLDSGASIRTDDTSEALIILFDQSTVVLYPRTELGLLAMEQTRFNPQRWSMVLVQNRGQTRITVSPPSGDERRFEVQAPQGMVYLEQGVFSISVQDDLVVRARQESRGWVSAAGDTITLSSGQKTQVLPGNPPTATQAAEEELLTNGHFLDGLIGWEASHEAGFTAGQDVPGQTQLTLDGGEAVVRLWRQGSHNTHSEVFITQAIDRDVTDFSTLQLRIQFKLLNQSLSGGGYMGSEYPLHIRVDYETARGSNFAVWGFYYQNRDQNRTSGGTLVPQGEWIDHTLEQNLMELIPQPRRIISIRISASGWDYESLVKGISLVGE